MDHGDDAAAAADPNAPSSIAELIAQFVGENRSRAREAEALVHQQHADTQAPALSVNGPLELPDRSAQHARKRQKIAEIVQAQGTHRLAYLNALTTEYKQRKHRWQKRLAAAEQRQQQADRAKERRRYLPSVSVCYD